MAKFLSELASADSSFIKPQELVDNYLSLRQQPGRFSRQAFEVIDSFRGTNTLEEFDTFAKAYYLRHTWKLEPQLMAELNEKYGPIDYNDPNRVLPLNWTLADVHAIYWAALGLQKASRQEYSVEELNTDRIVFHSLQNLYRMGKMIVYTSRVPAKNDPCNIVERQSVFLFPDLRMFDRYDQSLRVLLKKYAELGGNVESLRIAHKNTLKRGVLLFYQAGHISKAVEVYNALQKEYPQERDIHVPLAEYARNRLVSELKTMGFNDAREIITLMLQEAYYRYAVRDDDEAFGREKMAREIYDYYQKQYENEIVGVDRVVLPDFNVLRYIGISSFMNDLRYPDFVRQNLMERIRIERPDLYEQLKQQHETLMQEMEKQEGSQQ